MHHSRNTGAVWVRLMVLRGSNFSFRRLRFLHLLLFCRHPAAPLNAPGAHRGEELIYIRFIIQSMKQ
jgi:hypothetical protein